MTEDSKDPGGATGSGKDSVDVSNVATSPVVASNDDEGATHPQESSTSGPVEAATETAAATTDPAAQVPATASAVEPESTSGDARPEQSGDDEDGVEPTSQTDDGGDEQQEDQTDVSAAKGDDKVDESASTTTTTAATAAAGAAAEHQSTDDDSTDAQNTSSEAFAGVSSGKGEKEQGVDPVATPHEPPIEPDHEASGAQPHTEDKTVDETAAQLKETTIEDQETATAGIDQPATDNDVPAAAPTAMESSAPTTEGVTAPSDGHAMAATSSDSASLDAPAPATQPLTSPPLPSKQGTLPPPPVPGKNTSDVEEQSATGTTIENSSSSTAPTPSHKAVAKAFGVPQSPSDEKQQPSTPAKMSASSSDAPRTPSSGIKIGKGPPPTTNPEEEKPFDFNVFLEQMKDSSARGVGEYVRSFIRGFSKKPYRTADQIKLIFDFLDFISERMRQCAVWARLSETEFENAREAMEKLVMNRLYNFTFTPAVAKEGRWTPQTDDLERDRVLCERIELFSWLKEEHLDVPTGEHSRGFVDFAIQELLKINQYKAPRDKLICILNSCKVIFGLIRHMSSEENADTFIPILIFVVLKANPQHLISNVEYIGRFRNPDKLSSESGYYLSSLMGATAFIETMDYSSLSNISQEEFEQNVEEAVQKMAARPHASPAIAQGPTAAAAASAAAAVDTSSSSSTLLAPTPSRPLQGHQRTVSASDPHAPLGAGEGSATNLPGPQPPTFADDTRAFLQRTGEAARLGFSTSLGKPIGALGKLLGEGLEGIKTPGGGASGPSSSTASPARVDSPSLAALKGEKMAGGGLGFEGSSVAPAAAAPSASTSSAPRRGGVFSNLFGGEPSSPLRSTSSSSSNQPGGAGFNPGSWTRSFRGSDPGAAYDNDDDVVPQTPMGGANRQGPFSSLVRNPQYTDAVPPARRIGETPFAPRAARNRPGPPERSDSIDPFNSPDPSSGGFDTSDAHGSGSRTAAGFPRRRGGPDSDGIGTPSDGGSEVGDGEDDAGSSSSGGVLSQARRRLPDLGAFVPNFLTEGEDTPLRRGPAHAHHPGDSSLPLGPSSDDIDVQRIQEGQMAAALETLKSVFPDADDEVRRMVLEACGGDVGQAIDRLLEINQG